MTDDANFRPRPGYRLVAEWPVGDEPPAGWQRGSGVFPSMIYRVADGGPADRAAEVAAYTTSTDCGVSNVRLVAEPVKARRGV